MICRHQEDASGPHLRHYVKVDLAGGRRVHRTNGGFTLVELLIVTTILPLILGALAVGVISVFQLQTGVANRLGNTSDAQQISAVFANDVSGAQYFTTAPAISPSTDCVPAGSSSGYERIMGLEINRDSINGKFATLISYDRVSVTSPSGTTYELVRLACNGEGVTTATTTSVLAYGFSANDMPVANCTSNAPTTLAASPIACSLAIQSSGWMSTESVSDVTFAVVEPASGFSFHLAASPINNISSTVTGSPVSNSATSKCEAARPNTGSLSSTLCFVDFSQLNNSAVMAAARSGSCQEMSVSVGSGDTLFFCLAISGTLIEPSVLPTYSQAFLGNSFCLKNLAGGITIPPPYTSSTCLPFYSGIAGEPAMYLTRTSSSDNSPHKAILTFTGITVENSQGQAATGWHIVSADAESTDSSSPTNGESITWTADSPLTPICNGEFWDSCTTNTTNIYHNVDYFGNACLNDQPTPGLTPSTFTSSTFSITCAGNVASANESITSGPKSGAAMVEATTPSTMTITLDSPYGGLQAATFGLSVSGVSS